VFNWHGTTKKCANVLLFCQDIACAFVALFISQLLLISYLQFKLI